MMRPDEALERLMLGNQRFVAGQAARPNSSPTRRAEISQVQRPFAIILGCADSRVPPEIIFDCGLGDLFVVRTAGQVVDQAVMESLEFGVNSLGCTLLVVLGHTQCGAVTVAMEALSTQSKAGSTSILVRKIAPAIETGRAQKGDPLANAIRAHAALTIDELRGNPQLARAEAHSNLRLVAAHYDLETGRVDLII